MKEVNIKVDVKGKTFRAVRDSSGHVFIDRWNGDGCFWEWAGDGQWDSGVTNCTSDLGDAVYDAISNSISKELAQ